MKPYRLLPQNVSSPLKTTATYDIITIAADAGVAAVCARYDHL
jgi:hypothetical protein